MAKKKEKKKLHIEVIRQMLTLATSGFGFVAALAWNNVIQEFVKTYIKRFLPGNDSNMWSLLIYAVAVTILAVVITFQLSKILDRDK
ncbi:MAG TPA: DUF5654 family protein [Patescibacteria group bacterium]|nr:DUF5654 family protein [Patescibacteria group bacterium]